MPFSESVESILLHNISISAFLFCFGTRFKVSTVPGKAGGQKRPVAFHVTSAFFNEFVDKLLTHNRKGVLGLICKVR